MSLVPPSESDAAAHAQAEQAQLRLAIDLAGVVAWHHDLNSDLINCSDQVHGLLGSPPRPSGWLPEEFLALVHPDDQEAVVLGGQRAVAERVAVDVQARFRRRDGSWLHAQTRRVAQFDGTDRPVALLGVAMDVTGQHLALDELRSAGERIALITQGLGMGTWMVDLRENKHHWDAQMWLLRGRPVQVQAPSVKDMLAMVHAADREPLEALLRRLGAEGGELQYEFRIVLPEGGERWLASRSALVRDEHGQPLRRIGVNWNVTDARQAQADRHARALAQRESEAKSALMARLSHELRTPLNAILGFTRLLLADHQNLSAERRADRLLQIEGAGAHLLSLIDDLLELNRPEASLSAAGLQPVDIAALIAQVVPMVEDLAAARQLRWQIDVPTGCLVMADPLRLRQVVLNLLTNAIKYNRPGGLVQLSAERLGVEVALQVRDTGIGMAAEDLADCFMPFHRLAPALGQASTEGVGIGLAIVKTLTQRMGGTIEVQSELGQGSCFTLRLPAAAGSGPAPSLQVQVALPLESAEPLEPADPAPGAGAVTGPAREARLLYIEDNPVNMMIVAELVQRRGGIRFEGACSGAEGLALAQTLQPDLVLLDMHLPDAHGREVLARLRAESGTAAIPCIALSANALPADIEAALAEGFADYWTKPLDFKAFLAALDVLFGPAPAGSGG
ncbi:PAS domain-containing hybrid sensor histidine kinase/response regulator [Ideonella sp.]|uniref:hybrid sensor histidine kinase/response regulator n=1 Tax=Ideonella sp. TaxID=1929293 RepID=UPI003BB65D5B